MALSNWRGNAASCWILISTTILVVIILGKSTFRWELLEQLVASAPGGMLPAACFYPPEGGEAELIGGRPGVGYVINQALVRYFSHTDEGEPAMELYELPGGCHSLASRNLMDKVYAFLGMAKNRQQLGITP
ncbi:hypothetical protein CEP51_015445 [Fusarium floridanum]|uniref:Uncharacterized protein n=1 Tax=Fusarium floridanum TaxID=1325733 RepID=A0A428P9P4_9HYPO|nr:hypothetical protein CEP51_015445 [Fusarium floridanum]